MIYKNVSKILKSVTLVERIIICLDSHSLYGITADFGGELHWGVVGRT